MSALPRGPRTLALLLATFPQDLAGLIHVFFASDSTDSADWMRAGNYEACSLLTDENQLDECLAVSCELGDISLVNLMITRGATDYTWGLHGTCLGGHLELVNLMIARGVSDYNTGLYGACKGGYIAIVNLMITRGATDYNVGLHGACLGGHFDIANLMLANGATNYYAGLSGACSGRHPSLIRLMISHGATSCDCSLPIASHLEM